MPSIKAISSSPNNRPTPRERTANRAEREQQTIMQTKLEASVLEKEISDMRLVLDKKIVKLSQIHQRLERLERMSGMDLISRIDELTRQNSEILSKTDIKKFNFNVPEVETEISGDLISCDINELKIELPDEPEMEVKLEESCVVDNSPDNQAVDPFDLNSEFVECEKQKPAEIKPQNLKYVLLKLGSDKIPSLCTIPNATNIVKIDSSVKSTNSWITPKISKVYYNSEPKSIVIQAKKTIIYPQYKPTSYIKILPRPKLTIIKSNIPNVTQPLIVNKELVLKPLNIETYNKKQQAHIVTPSCSSTNQIKVEDLSTGIRHFSYLDC